MQNKIDELKRELSSLKKDFSRRVDEIEHRINFLESQSTNTQISKVPPLQKEPLKSMMVEKGVRTAVKVPPLPPPIPEPKQAKKEPGYRKTIFTGLSEAALQMFGPVAALFVRFLDIYKHYQSQGKAPVFFMTIAGILTLVMGFGYLLQYSFSQFLNPMGKVAIGFVAASGITFCGALITRKREDMSDYASSLIGLGMILFYLSAYFTGSFYHILSDFWSFILLAAITGIAYTLAITFKTRIVAMISLLGGAVAPLLMAGADQTYQVYLAYILILVTAMLHLSRKINWQFLARTSIIISFIVIEFVLSAVPELPAVPIGFIFLIHLFFYVFMGYNSLEVIKRSSITKAVILVFSSNIFFYLYALYQVVYEHKMLGMLYLLNATILAIAFFSIPLLIKLAGKTDAFSKKLLQKICLLSIGLLAGFGILALVSTDFLGLSWGIEALVLLYMGSRFKITQARVEAHIILILSLVLSVYHTTTWLISSLVPPPEIFQLEFGYGWMNLILTWTLLWPYVILLERHQEHLIPHEKQWLTICNEGLSVCLSLSFLLSIGVVWTQGIWLMSVVPLFFLIYRAKIKHLVFTEYLGLSHFLLLGVPMLTSASIVSSFFFSEQLALGKVARVEAFLCLFLIAEFYRRFYGDSKLDTFAQILRQAFFCIIPLSFLPGIWHQYIYYFPFAFWISSGICLGLFYWLKYPVLLTELKLLVIGSSLISVIACALVKFAGWPGHGTLALTTGLVFYAAVLFIWKGLRKDQPGSEAFLLMRNQLSLFFSLLFYYLGIFLFIILFGITGAAPLALTIMIAYFGFLFIKLPLFEPLKNNAIILYTIVPLFSGAMILIHLLLCIDGFIHIPGIGGLLFQYGIFNILVLILFGFLVHQRISYFEEVRNRLGGQIYQLWGFHGLTCLTYGGTLSQWFNKGFGPAFSVALVLHATLVLFLTLKHRFQKLISLAIVLFAVAAGKIILWDMNDFSIIQKMIAFIIIGSLLLGAAYQYQKMKANVVESEGAQPENPG